MSLLRSRVPLCAFLFSSISLSLCIRLNCEYRAFLDFYLNVICILPAQSLSLPFTPVPARLSFTGSRLVGMIVKIFGNMFPSFLRFDFHCYLFLFFPLFWILGQMYLQMLLMSTLHYQCMIVL